MVATTRIVFIPNGISIGLSVFEGLIGMPNGQTKKERLHHVTTSVALAHILYYAMKTQIVCRGRERERVCAIPINEWPRWSSLKYNST